MLILSFEPLCGLCQYGPLFWNPLGGRKTTPRVDLCLFIFILRLEPCLSRLPLGGAKGPDGVTKRKGG